MTFKFPPMKTTQKRTFFLFYSTRNRNYHGHFGRKLIAHKKRKIYRTTTN